MHWNSQLSESLIWLVKSFCIVMVASAAVAAIFARTTRWGRQFWRLTGPYFMPQRNWRPLAIVCFLVFFSLFSVRMDVLLSFWRNDFYNTLQDLNQKAFWKDLGLFAILASVTVAQALVAYIIGQAFNIRWRAWLNDRLTQDWLAGQAYYRGQFVDHAVDNPDQRIQQDVSLFVEGSGSLVMGAISSVVSLAAFTVILWGLSAPLNLMGVEIPRAMVFLVYLYVIVATWLAFFIGRPLIRLNFLSEQLTANFRYALMRLRENAENVAFYQGENVERGALLTRFKAYIANMWALVFRNLRFTGFNLVADQIAVVFPYLLQAPRFFSGAIKLGDMMQTAEAFGQVQGALSFFRTSYDTFAQYRATLDRLDGFLNANAAARRLPTVQLPAGVGAEVGPEIGVGGEASPAQAGSSPGLPREGLPSDDLPSRALPPQDLPFEGLSFDGLSVSRPDGQALLRDLSLQLRPGQSLLIKGPSGSGKTTLLRAVAGLWPYAQGSVTRPLGAQSLFLSQRPYLPLGDLRGALAYPGEIDLANDERVQDALRQVNLGHLAGKLDEAAEWSRILSIGEQQRVAFARVLLNQPRVVFLDEATSAMDEGLEYTLYTLLRKNLPGSVLVSVGHRGTLDAFHSHRLVLDGKGGWQLELV